MRFLSLFLLVVICHLAYGQKNKLDSLYNLSEKHEQEDTIRTMIMFDICYLESYSNPEKSKALAEQALRISKELRHVKGEGFANRYLADYYVSIGDKGQAVTFAYAMLKNFEQIGPSKGLGQANQLLGRVHEELREYEKANVFYYKALTIYEQLGLKRDVGYCYNSLGSLQFSLSHYDSALKYYLKSADVRKEISDERGLGQVYGNIASIYVNLANYPLAEDHFEKALIINQKLDNKFYLAVLYNNMGKLYTIMGRYEKANEYLFQSVSLAKALGNKRILADTYDKLGKLEQRKGRLNETLSYFELKNAYRDSLFTEEKAKQLAEAQTRYETEKKNQAIQLLERDNRIQQLWTNIFVAAFISLAILFAVVYFFQRYRAGKNRRILDLEIDNLTAQRNAISEKFKQVLASGSGELVESHDQLLLKKAIEIVERNISDTLFGVEQMADELNMSRTSLNRKLKFITGFPPSELIRNIRLRKAASLLRSRANTVTEISIAVGFEEQSYFSKSFKKQFGVPPSEYFGYATRNEAMVKDDTLALDSLKLS